MSLKKTAAGLLAAICLLSAPAGAFTTCAFKGDTHASSVVHTLVSKGRYTNWAGVSSVSQFTDEQGRFCFAVDCGDHVDIYRTKGGAVQEGEPLTVQNPYDNFGGALCGKDGSLYLIWGRNNVGSGADTSLSTIFVSKYTSGGTLVATAGGNGSEGMAYYYDGEFNTMAPFNSANCDAAINGGVLMVNYARKMYNGHQSNTVFAVDTDTMKVLDGYSYYNSHSFDQRVSPYGNGFVLASQGDCYDRGFALTMANGKGNGKSVIPFHFWVEKGALDNNIPKQLNKTRARLGNVLETEAGIALIGASVRSLSEAADSEPQDVFVQVLDPATGKFAAGSERTGFGNNNGDKIVTDYGVRWLTDFGSSGGTVDVVQAVSLNGGKLAVLYELNKKGLYDSTWAAILNADGSVFQAPVKLGTMRLNTDEDPVFADGAVQWVANAAGEKTLSVYSLRIDLAETGTVGDGDGALTWAFFRNEVAILRGSVSAAEPVIAAAYGGDGRMLAAAALTGTQRETSLPENAATVKLFWLDENGVPKGEAITLR